LPITLILCAAGSAAQTLISHKGIFRVLPIFRTHFSHANYLSHFRISHFADYP